jgi:DNA-binding NarL/FixJ family response regulator
MPKRIRILLVDDHPVVLKGLAATIAPEPDMEVAGCATTGREAIRMFRELAPDVTVMDIVLTPEMSGIEVTAAIRAEFPDAKIVVLTAYQGDDVIYRALKAGAASYLLKECLGDELVQTIREVHSGGGAIPPNIGRKFADQVNRPALTARETEVLRLIADGFRNKEIAEQLKISEQTVFTHVRNVFFKLGVNDRTKAVNIAFRRGIIDPMA